MPPVPLLYTDIPANAETYSRQQIDQINAFFGSTIGILTFSLIWIICVIAMFVITGYALFKSEKEAQNHPEIVQEKLENGTLLLTSAAADLPFEMQVNNNFSQYLSHGRYYRML